MSMKRLVPVLVLTALCALLWAQVVLSSQNTLFLHPDWQVDKRMLEMAPMGADEFIITRTPLAGNTLRLGTWWGYQALTLKRSLEAREIDFRFRLGEGAEVTVLWGRSDAGGTALRLSRSAEHPSAFLRVTTAGAFDRRQLLAPLELNDGWHEAMLRLVPFGSGHAMTARVDGHEVLHTEVPEPATGTIAFRGGFAAADVDDVIIVDAAGRRVEESFDLRGRRLALLSLNFSFLVVLLSALLLIDRYRTGHWRAQRSSFQGALLVLLALCFHGGVWYAFDVAYWSRLGLNPLAKPIRSELGRFNLVVERIRYRFFEGWLRLAGGTGITALGVSELGYPSHRIYAGPVFCSATDECRLLSETDVEKLPAKAGDAYRVLFVGSSQTIGAGADRLGQTFFVQVHHLLGEDLPARRRLESLNIAVSAVRSAQQWNEYSEVAPSFAPDLVVINLGSNDREEELRTGISKFLDYNKGHTIPTVLLQEAYADEAVSARLLAIHAVLRILGEERGVPVWDVHGYLSGDEMRDSGFLWWDAVHMTSWAQRQVARWLAPQLRGEIGRSLGRNGPPAVK